MTKLIDAKERRAETARLSVCVLSGAIAISLFAVPMAHAEKPSAPRLTATDPISTEASPATSTNPFVSGEAEPEGGVIIEVATPPRLTRVLKRGAVVKHPTNHPNYEIVIFGQAGCKGLPVGEGQADALEGLGIPLTVAENAETTLSAQQIDPSDRAHPSECSTPFPYWEGNVAGGGVSPGGGESPGSGAPAGPPSESVAPAVGAGALKPEPPHPHVSPSGRANDNTPLVAGSAPGAATVLIFANSSCSGSPVARGSADQFAAGLQVQVADNTTTTFSAVSMAGQRSACSSPVIYIEDSTAPLTRITMGPGVKTRRHKAVFRFIDSTDDPPGTTFLCRVDHAKWRPCSSPLRLRHLHLHRYVMRVRATDLAGNIETKAVKRSFKVIRLR